MYFGVIEKGLSKGDSEETGINTILSTMIKVKRIYETPHPDDGYRVLVDRLWPRGVSKQDAKLDEWFKSIAPSNELRKWFDHDPNKWEEFKNRYLEELGQNRKEVKVCYEKIEKQEIVTLLYGSKEARFNHAHFLKDFFE